MMHNQDKMLMAGDGGVVGNKDDILANLKTKAKKHEVLDGKFLCLRIVISISNFQNN